MNASFDISYYILSIHVLLSQFLEEIILANPSFQESF